MGRARAKQTRIGAEGRQPGAADRSARRCRLCRPGHLGGNAELVGLEAYPSAASVHIIVNNLIGFTTDPSESHSSRFSSDLAKRLPIPIFHVNAEDPDAVVRVGAHRRRLPLRVRERRRRDRSDRLSPPRPQRSGRPDHHAAAALPQNPGAPAAVADLCPENRRGSRADGRSKSARNLEAAQKAPRN